MIPFRSKKHHIDGHSLDSTAELKRYGELKLLLRAGEIEDLRVHPKHVLTVNGEKVATYSPDFSYIQQGRGVVYEDVKSAGTLTPYSALKIRLFNALKKTEVQIIGKGASKVRRFKAKVAA